MSHHENCHVEPTVKPFDEAALAEAMVAYLAVSGMGCERCAMRVRNGLLNQEGVVLADVFLHEGVAAVTFDAARLHPDWLLEVVAGAGNDGRHRYWAEVIAVKSAAEALTLQGDARTWT
jgi:copper chaperone CopZ